MLILTSLDCYDIVNIYLIIKYIQIYIRTINLNTLYVVMILCHKPSAIH